MKKIAVIGAGPMGLAACYHLLKSGHEVTLYEADKIIGGMSASFDFDGLKIERYYHFICKADQPLFDLLDELGISSSLQWRDTKMGYFIEGKTRPWGDPFALLKFPALSLLEKIRYGLLAFSSTKRQNWKKLDTVDAVSWLKKWCGNNVYDVLWKPLFELKFYQFTPNLSAAWIWSRLKRVGTSRRNLFQESLGYLDGGSDTFLYAIRSTIEALGGKVKTSTPVNKVIIEEGRVTGVETATGIEHYDRVVSTIPLPYVSEMIPDLPRDVLDRYESVNNIAVVCVLAKLKRPLSEYFWLNISDQTMDIPGLVEYSNLCPLDEHIVYVPYYLPGDHPKYLEPDHVFIDKVSRYLKAINPDLSEQDIISIKAGRYRYAQPICEPEFLSKLPPISPGIPGLFVADTSYYYPEDRSISESVRFGKMIGNMAGQSG